MGYAGVSYVQPQCRMSGQVIGVLNHVGELFGSRISLTARHGADQASEPSNRRALRARRYALLLPSFLAPSDRPTDTFSHTNGQGAQLPPSLPSFSPLLFGSEYRCFQCIHRPSFAERGKRKLTGKGAMAEVGISAFTLTRSLIKASDVQLANPFLL